MHAQSLRESIALNLAQIGVPLITRYVFKSVAKVQERRGTSSEGPLDEVRSCPRLMSMAHLAQPEEREYLERVRHEASLPEYNLFVDYAEMAVQVCQLPCSIGSATE